jgi:hypothetical protein
MRTLSAAELLEAWDRGCLETPLIRPLAVLAAACDVPAAGLAAASLGHRDSLLLALRERTFGRWLDGLATCPGCAEELQVALAVDDSRAPGNGTDPAEDPAADMASAGPFRLEANGYHVVVRVPDSRDAAAAAAAASVAVDGPATARSVLLDRSVTASDQTGKPVPAAELPEDVVDAAVACMAEADPQADVRLAVTCPSCGATWEVPFDPGSFLWSEVEAWARRTVLEVHQLAAAYGWTEADVLALGPRRRQAYLELTGG